MRAALPATNLLLKSTRPNRHRRCLNLYMADVIKCIEAIPMGGTDCALPMMYATHHKLEVDTFIVYTDSETWAGKMHPVQALKEYRQRMGIGAKLVVVGMVSSEFTIADPNDAGMLDVVGFDSAAPSIISDFSRV